ncbi:hypothetical protein [Pseudoflavonifractor capillosus]|nr:hypothetical protein [Pseudoflavonifractor capillosus]
MSLLLALTMVLGLLPTGALAAEGAAEISDQIGLAGMTDGSYILTQDIALSEWTAIDFSGTLDGNGHTITLNGAPLFKELSGTVQNLLLVGEAAADDAAGALALSLNGGTVNNCWSGADVMSYYDSAAGFIGTVVSGTIRNCLFAGNYADYGIATTADSGSRIENCYYPDWLDASDGAFAAKDNEGIRADRYPDVCPGGRLFPPLHERRLRRHGHRTGAVHPGGAEAVLCRAQGEQPLQHERRVSGRRRRHCGYRRDPDPH